MNTLFRAKSYRALSAGRRLTLAFWLGALLSYLSYVLAVALTLAVPELFIFGLSGRISTAVTSLIKYSCIIALFPTLIMLAACAEALAKMKHHDAADIARSLGAKPCTKQRNERIFTNIVAEMSLASGTQIPETFILHHDHSINAFVLSGANNTLVLTVSQGALDCLTRDELQAVIAHEFAHIKNDDLGIYRRLIAMLQGYYSISEWRYAEAKITTAREASLFSFNLFSDQEGNNIVGFIIGSFGYFFYLYGQILQAAFSRQREYLADACAVQYTRHSQALLNALKKALALQRDGVRLYSPPRHYAHIYFIRYQKAQHWLFATHPTLEQRIAEYGGNVCEDELNALLFEIQNTRRENSSIDLIQHYKTALNSNIAYPLLSIDRIIAVQQFPRPVNPGAALLALFIYYSGISFFDIEHRHLIPVARLNAAEQAFNAIERTPVLNQIPLLSHLSQAGKSLSPAEKKLLNQDIAALIKAQTEINRYEACVLICWHSTTHPTLRKQHYLDYDISIARLLAYLIKDNMSKNSAEQRYAELVRTTLPIAVPFSAVAESNTNHLQLCRLIAALRNIAPLYRDSLRTGIEQYYCRQKELPLTSAYLRYTLHYALR